MAIVLSMQRCTLPRSPTGISCKECGKTNSLVSDYAAGDLICTKCGCVAGRVQDEGEDWRAYSNGKEVKGAQHVVTFGELGSATELTCQRPNMFLPRGYHPKVKRSEKLLLRCLQGIQSMCRRLLFPKIIVDTASSTLRSAMLIPFLAITMRKRRRAFLTATIVIASRKHSCARSLKEVSASTGTEWKSVAKCYSRIVEKLNIQIKPQRAHQFVRRFCCLLRIPRAISEVVAQLASRYATSASPESAKPTTVAAAAIMFISTMSIYRLEAKRVAAVAFVSYRTLVNVYADMYNKLDALFTTEDLINLQEQNLDMRKLLSPDVIGKWKKPKAKEATASSTVKRGCASTSSWNHLFKRSCAAATSPSRKRSSASNSTVEPRGKIARSKR